MVNYDASLLHLRSQTRGYTLITWALAIFIFIFSLHTNVLKYEFLGFTPIRGWWSANIGGQACGKSLNDDLYRPLGLLLMFQGFFFKKNRFQWGMPPRGYTQDGGIDSKMLGKKLEGFEKQLMLFSLSHLRSIYDCLTVRHTHHLGWLA